MCLLAGPFKIPKHKVFENRLSIFYYNNVIQSSSNLLEVFKLASLLCAAISAQISWHSSLPFMSCCCCCCCCWISCFNETGAGEKKISRLQFVKILCQIFNSELLNKKCCFTHKRAFINDVISWKYSLKQGWTTLLAFRAKLETSLVFACP